MKKITKLELLIRVANGTGPERFIFNDCLYRKGRSDKKNYYGEAGTRLLNCVRLDELNEEIELLDEEPQKKKKNKIEKINDILRVNDLEPPYDCNLEKIWIQTIKNHNKINELIDKLNSIEKEGINNERNFK